MAVSTGFMIDIHSALECLNYKVYEIDVKLHTHRPHPPDAAHLYIAQCQNQGGDRWGHDRVVAFDPLGNVEAVYQCFHYDLSAMVAWCVSEPMEHGF